MPDPTTTNFGFDLPVVGGDSDTWGTSLNGNWAALDATLGAVLTGTGNRITPGGMNVSAAAWTTSGLRARFAGATYTDTSSSGTVAAVYVDAHKAATIAASSATTYTNAYGAYFENPVAGSNVTFGTLAALGADSLRINGGSVISNLAQGTWAPVDVSGASLSITVNKAEYFQIGNLVIAYFNVTYPTTVSGNSARVGGLPVVAANAFGLGLLSQTFSNTAVATANSGSSQVWFYTNQGATIQPTNANFSGLQLIGTVIYFTS